jgi:hypothetical protein
MQRVLNKPRCKGFHKISLVIRKYRRKPSKNLCVLKVSCSKAANHCIVRVKKTLMEEVPCRSAAEFIVPYLGDQVDYGIGLLYRPANYLCSMTASVGQPYAIVNLTHPPPPPVRGHYFYTVFEPFR